MKVLAPDRSYEFPPAITKGYIVFLPKHLPFTHNEEPTHKEETMKRGNREKKTAFQREWDRKSHLWWLKETRKME